MQRVCNQLESSYYNQVMTKGPLSKPISVQQTNEDDNDHDYDCGSVMIDNEYTYLFKIIAPCFHSSHCTLHLLFGVNT